MDSKEMQDVEERIEKERIMVGFLCNIELNCATYHRAWGECPMWRYPDGSQVNEMGRWLWCNDCEYNKKGGIKD